MWGQTYQDMPCGVKSCNHTFDENETAEVQVLLSNISRRVTVQNLLPSFHLAERLTKSPKKLKISLVSPFL